MFGSLRKVFLFSMGVIFWVFPLGATGASPFYQPSPTMVDIPTPESVLGYPLGEQFTPHHRVVDYMRLIAEASPRVQLEQYGTTTGGRPLLLLTITDPNRPEGLQELRDSYQELADPRRTPSRKARAMARDLPVAVWLSFNIHGNETSSTEAAMAVVYALASSQDPHILEYLERTVVLVDPCLNPDGRDRYVNWFNGVTGSRANPLNTSREHREPWPGGRYNHYLFDLNRDWAWLTQSESQARAQVYLAWRPQVHVDFHEMWYSSTYFFFPPERPVHKSYPPSVLTWGRIFGDGNARAFDERGWRYYTAEDFDLFYPGYGDSWPTFHGAIGMTYEQAGHGRAGITIERRDGNLLTLSDRTEHHYTAAMATIRTAASNREAKLLDFYRFFEIPERPTVAAYVLPAGADPGRTAELVSLLMANGAEVYETRGSFAARGLVDYSGNTYRGSLPGGTYVVPMDQPLHRFLSAVLEPAPDIPDTMFYDLSAWSLPLAFGVEAYLSANPISGNLRRLSSAPQQVGNLKNPMAQYAFLIPSERNATMKAMADLMNREIHLHFTTKPMTIDNRDYPAGTFVVFRKDNPENIDSVLEEVALAHGAEILGVDSGLTDAGPDLGSNHVQYLKPFHVGLVTGDPVKPTSLGSCWFLLDKHYNFPHSLVRVQDISPSLLEDFDVIVFPDDGSHGHGYTSALDSSQVQDLKSWVRGGGVFVGLGGGGFFATQDRSGLATTEIVDPDADLSDDEKDARDKERKLETLDEQEKRKWAEHLPGTIFNVRVDPKHPLGFGYQGSTRVLMTDSDALKLGPPGSNVAVFTESPRVSGYVLQEQEDQFVDTPYLVAERSGRGYVVMYAGDPNFRLFWYGLNRLFLNSLCFLPSM